MTFRLIRIPTDLNNPIEEIVRDVDEKDLSAVLKMMQELVADGSGQTTYVEPVRTQLLHDATPDALAPENGRWAYGPHAYKPWANYPMLLVDEDGIGKGLPVNARASLLYPSDSHRLHGPALLVWNHRDEVEGDEWVGLPTEFTVEHLESELAKLAQG